MEGTIIDVTDDGGASGIRDGGPPTAADRGWRPVGTADGTVVAWRADGPVVTTARQATPVVLCNGIACSTHYWTPLATRLSERRRVVQWDYRGHGRSATPSDPAATTIHHVVDDLVSVLAAARTDRAVLVGHSFGVQVALEAARRHPQRVAAVVAIAGAAGRPLPDALVGVALGPLVLAQRAHGAHPGRVREIWRLLWRSPLPHLLARAVGGTSLAAPRHVMRAYYDHVSDRDLDVLLAMMRAMQDHDATDVVPRLSVPLLVLAGGADRVTPLPVLVRLALAAPDGELAVCHGGTHTLPIEHPDWIVEQVGPLLDRVDGPATTSVAIATGA